MDENLEYVIRPRTSFSGWTDDQIKQHKKAQQSKLYKQYYQRKKTEQKKLLVEKDEALIHLATETDKDEINILVGYIDAINYELSLIPFN